MANEFPFGQNWSTHETWLGTWPSLSSRWRITYDGNFSLACGFHSFIFLGLDNLVIANVSLTGCGPSVGLPVGRIVGRVADASADAAGTAWDIVTGAQSASDAINNDRENDARTSGMELYRKMMQATPNSLTGLRPFSLPELAGQRGTVAGAEVQLMKSASLYFISAGSAGLPGAGRPTDFLFSSTDVVNSAGGTISASIGQLEGIWSVDNWFNLYAELGYAETARCSLQNSSSNYSQPFRQILGVHPVIAELPPPGCDLSEEAFNPMGLLE